MTPVPVSILIATWNRPGDLAATIDALGTLDWSGVRPTVTIVDNAGAGEVRRVVERRPPRLPVQVVDAPRNLGPCGKTVVLDRLTDPVTLFLDDDSVPAPGCVQTIVRRLQADPGLGALGTVAVLEDGRRECSALPGVFIGCGVGFRTEALRAAGGLDPWFFMAAEEYDLSFRLAQLGWSTRTDEDLEVHHRKSPVARGSARTLRLDARNNAFLATRWLPAPFDRLYRREWALRYRWLLADVSGGAPGQAVATELVGTVRGLRRRMSPGAHPLDADAFERFFHHAAITARFHDLAAVGCRRVRLVSLGKTALAFRLGARAAGIDVAGLHDERPFTRGRRWHEHAIGPIETGFADDVDAVVISDSSPVRTAAVLPRCRAATSVPVHGWFEGAFRPGAERTMAAGNRALETA